MASFQWRERAGTVFACEKTSVTARRGMAVTNHPLASAAAMEMPNVIRRQHNDSSPAPHVFGVGHALSGSP